MGVRVLVLSWEYPPIVEGGLARHVRKLAEGLAGGAAGEPVDVHVLTRGGDHAPAVEERHGVVVHRVREPAFPRGDLDAFLAWVHQMNADMLAAGVALSGFDVVHSHDWLVARAAERLAERLGVPWVVTVHATEHGRHQGWVEQHPQSVIHAAEERMVRRADAVVVCSEFMRTHVREALGVDARVVPNGIDPDDLRLAPDVDLDALRARYAPGGERLVLLAGRLVHEKGFQVALDALGHRRFGVLRRVPGVRYLVAGTGTHEAELRAQARRLRIVRRGTFAGWLGDDALHGLYRVAGLCVVPSLYEPFGLVALEAMASGCPTVVADTGGLREVVPAGLRFAARDPRALAAAMERVLTDDALRRRLVREGRAHAQRFDWADVAARTAALYREIAPQRAQIG